MGPGNLKVMKEISGKDNAGGRGGVARRVQVGQRVKLGEGLVARQGV